MRCPDCGTDYPVKPEVVIQKEPCKCGMTADFRTMACIIRSVVAGVVLIVFGMGGCTAYQSYLNSRIAEKGDVIDFNGTLIKPVKK